MARAVVADEWARPRCGLSLFSGGHDEKRGKEVSVLDASCPKGEPAVGVVAACSRSRAARVPRRRREAKGPHRRARPKFWFALGQCYIEAVVEGDGRGDAGINRTAGGMLAALHAFVSDPRISSATEVNAYWEIDGEPAEPLRA